MPNKLSFNLPSGEPFAVALDGPSGAGKSSIAKAVARNLKIIYVDTGAMYRAIALFIFRKGLDTKNPAEVVPELNNINIKTTLSEELEQKIFLNGEDVSIAIRKNEISIATSNVSSIPEVRTFLLKLQRDMAVSRSVIMDGRDIGTVVLPNAQVKIFITASSNARANRRYLEYVQKGIAVNFDEILNDIILRDEQDSNRTIAPLRQAEDAVLLDTTSLNFEESVDAVENLIKERLRYVSENIL